MMQTQELTKLRGELQASEALQPIVPVITMSPASDGEVKNFVELAKTVYADMTVTSQGNTLTVQSRDTGQFSQFREALGHAVNGGINWKVRVDAMCIGRECQSNPLNAVLKIEKFGIDRPAPPSE